MSLAMLCHGCGLRSDVPDDYTRKKMRCPHCGVICPVPERPGLPPPEESAPAAPPRKPPAPTAPRSKPERSAPDAGSEDDWARFFLEESSASAAAPAPAPPPPVPAPAAAPAPAAPAAPAAERRVSAPTKRRVPGPP